MEEEEKENKPKGIFFLSCLCHALENSKVSSAVRDYPITAQPSPDLLVSTQLLKLLIN